MPEGRRPGSRQGAATSASLDGDCMLPPAPRAGSLMQWRRRLARRTRIDEPLRQRRGCNQRGLGYAAFLTGGVGSSGLAPGGAGSFAVWVRHSGCWMPRPRKCEPSRASASGPQTTAPSREVFNHSACVSARSVEKISQLGNSSQRRRQSIVVIRRSCNRSSQQRSGFPNAALIALAWLFAASRVQPPLRLLHWRRRHSRPLPRPNAFPTSRRSCQDGHREARHDPVVS